jgi:arginase
VITSIAVIGAPSAIGIRPYDDGSPRRLDLAPDALRALGLAERIGAVDLGNVDPPGPYRDRIRPRSGVRNENDVAIYSRALANKVAATAERSFVLLLGGDCSILLGGLLGLRQSGRRRVGLVYIDAHSDFATLQESPSGSACSMNLALAVARFTTGLAKLDPDGPLVRPSDVAHVGSRDEDQAYGNAWLAPMGVLNLSSQTISRIGIEEVALRALARVAAAEGGFWIALDVDVLQPVLMPAVDSPIAGGLDFDQLGALLRILLQHPAALGLQVTIYDPTLDPDGKAGSALVDMLEQAFAGRSAR